MARKRFFKDWSAAEIRLGRERILETSSGLINRILSLEEEEALLITRDLIPNDFQGSRKYMKHADDVKLKRFSSLEEAVAGKKKPRELMMDAFDNLKSPFVSGYSFKPVMGPDKRKRKVSLVECVEGAKIFSYVHQPGSGFVSSIDVVPYDEVGRVAIEGADIVLRVPSRSKRASRYEFKLMGVPVNESEDMWALWQNLSTTHDPKFKTYNIRYGWPWKKESSRFLNFSSHEVAAYLAIAEHYWKEDRNPIPWQMNPFAVPTKLTADFYNKLSGQCLIKTGGKTRELNNGEKEILLWALVKRKGYETTFSPKGKLRDYVW